MFLFLVMSLGVLIGAIVAVEWMLDRWVGHSARYGDAAARRQVTAAERRARHRAEFDAICADMLQRQMAIAHGWPVSAPVAHIFRVATDTTVKCTRARREVWEPIGFQ